MTQKVEKLAWQEVDSSNVQSLAYVEDHETICVRFKNGGLYTYMGADQNTYTGLIHAESIGKYLNNVVKAMHAYTRWDTETELINSFNT